MKPRRLNLIIAVVGMAVLILDSRHAALYAAEGIELCMKSVIPSLFPLFLLSIYLIGNLQSPGITLPIVLSGLLGGYPVGAQAAADCWRTGRITRHQAEGLLMFCSQAGPAFLFGMVASAFPERKYAWMLWFIQLLSALSVGLLTFSPVRSQKNSINRKPIALTAAMQSAIRAMASVCGWVVLFRVLLGYISRLPMEKTAFVLLSGILELSNGCFVLEKAGNLKLRFFLAATMLNFGGVCVILQTASVTRGLKLRYYLMGKLLQTAFSALYCLFLLGYPFALVPVLGIFLLFGIRNPAKKSSIPVQLRV